jgi:hypothetical protein
VGRVMKIRRVGTFRENRAVASAASGETRQPLGHD